MSVMTAGLATLVPGAERFLLRSHGMRPSLSLVLCVVLFACGGNTPPPAPEPVITARNCGPADPDLAMSRERCDCLGGHVRGDTGDGSVRCAHDELEHGPVAFGIEGGLCCAPASTP
jgi:hypothetical protein